MIRKNHGLQRPCVQLGEPYVNRVNRRLNLLNPRCRVSYRMKRETLELALIRKMRKIQQTHKMVLVQRIRKNHMNRVTYELLQS